QHGQGSRRGLGAHVRGSRHSYPERCPWRMAALCRIEPMRVSTLGSLTIPVVMRGPMHRQGYDLQLTQYDDRGWRATFYATGMEHSPTSATGTAWERTAWRATQRAASNALKKSIGGHRE